MVKALCNLVVVLLCVASAPALAQQDKAALPRVLIIGDAVYHQARGVSNDLKDHARIDFVRWPAGVLPSSTNAIAYLDVLLGLKDASGNDVPEAKRPTWDVIHFNVGLGDLVYCVPNIKSHRVLPHTAGGVIRTDAARYEANLNTLVESLKQKAPGAKLIWASTTPIRHSRDNVFKPGDEIGHNAIAARVMTARGVPINDMYTYVKDRIDMDKPAGHGADPFHFDKHPLHPPVVAAIANAMGIPVPKPPADTKK